MTTELQVGTEPEIARSWTESDLVLTSNDIYHFCKITSLNNSSMIALGYVHETVSGGSLVLEMPFHHGSWTRFYLDVPKFEKEYNRRQVVLATHNASLNEADHIGFFKAMGTEPDKVRYQGHFRLTNSIHSGYGNWKFFAGYSFGDFSNFINLISELNNWKIEPALLTELADTK